ncbi:MAG: hypothetical protein ACC656_12370 [Candidatus Heimdallarchaeota archaeon]
MLLNFATFNESNQEKNTVISEVIAQLKTIDKFPVNPNMLQDISIKLKNIDIRPIDIDAAINQPRKQQQYLITGPSAPGGGGQGALKDLEKLLSKSS